MIEAKPGQKVKPFVEHIMYCGLCLTVSLGRLETEAGGTAGLCVEQVVINSQNPDITALCAHHGDLLDAVQHEAVKSVYAASGAEVRHE